MRIDHDSFVNLVDSLSKQLEALLSYPSIKPTNSDIPTQGGVYLFSQQAPDGNETYNHAGRAINLRRRHKEQTSNKHISHATFMFKFAKEEFKNDNHLANLKLTRAQLWKADAFQPYRVDAHRKICAMQYRFVVEEDDLRQSLLEIYCSEVLGSKYNDWKTH